MKTKCASCRGFGYTKGGPAGPWEKLDCPDCVGGEVDPDRDHVHTKDDPRVFVFGSNLRGIHGAGAARYARNELGAQLGVGIGRTGRCYALPTCEVPGVPVSLESLSEFAGIFLDHARRFPGDRFFLSKVGCGIAGFTEEVVSLLFVGAPENVDLPPSWRP